MCRDLQKASCFDWLAEYVPVLRSPSLLLEKMPQFTRQLVRVGMPW
jgi:hypothetical protein